MMITCNSKSFRYLHVINGGNYWNLLMLRLRVVTLVVTLVILILITHGTYQVPSLRSSEPAANACCKVHWIRIKPMNDTPVYSMYR